jgi:hypothetical protein
MDYSSSESEDDVNIGIFSSPKIDRRRKSSVAVRRA